MTTCGRNPAPAPHSPRRPSAGERLGSAVAEGEHGGGVEPSGKRLTAITGGHREERVLLALGLAMLTVALGIGVIVPLLPVYADELGAGATWAGLIFGINAGVLVFTAPVFGPLAAMSGTKRLLLTGLAGFPVVAVVRGRLHQGGTATPARSLSPGQTRSCLPFQPEGTCLPEGELVKEWRQRSPDPCGAGPLGGVGAPWTDWASCSASA